MDLWRHGVEGVDIYTIINISENLVPYRVSLGRHYDLFRHSQVKHSKIWILT